MRVNTYKYFNKMEKILPRNGDQLNIENSKIGMLIKNKTKKILKDLECKTGESLSCDEKTSEINILAIWLQRIGSQCYLWIQRCYH